jgi:short subunit dehydrogenase-like uncharacterized protein
MASRDHDLVLFGATGFTGKLVAEYLATAAPRDMRWALAGRNRAKLTEIRDELAAAHPHLADLPLLHADSTDQASLDDLAASTRVVCTTVGPYIRYGLPLVDACVRHGTDYCDLTGEVPFMRRTIAAHHEAAMASGARIVHTCGYDSIPSDLGAWMLQQDMIAHGGPAQRIKMVVGPSSGGPSGGTIASMMEIMQLAQDRDERRGMAHPYALNPEGDHGTGDSWDSVGVAFDDDAGRWTAPFIMAGVNTRVVRRSHALLGHPWGKDFSYTEVISTGRSTGARFRALGITAGLGAFVALAATGPTRALMQRTVLPSPGEGPSKETRENGYFRHLFIGVGHDPSHRRIARVVGQKDPGYGGTAIMLGEAALSLVLDRDKLPARAGILTPSTAMGQVLIDRLVAAGMTFETEAYPPSGVPSF